MLNGRLDGWCFPFLFSLTSQLSKLMALDREVEFVR